MEARIAVLVVSDTRSAGTRSDESGPEASSLLIQLGFPMPKLMLVADEVDQIQEAIRELSKDADLILTLGGTGFSPRDVTPEATRAVLDRQAPNLAELLRYEGSKKTPFSYLSRGVAGVRGQTLIVNLPGSPRGVAECIGALAPLLPPILSELRGDGCTVI